MFQTILLRRFVNLQNNFTRDTRIMNRSCMAEFVMGRYSNRSKMFWDEMFSRQRVRKRL